MKNKFSKTGYLIILVAAACALLSGCGKTESTTIKEATPYNKFWVERKMRQEMKMNGKIKHPRKIKDTTLLDIQSNPAQPGPDKLLESL